MKRLSLIAFLILPSCYLFQSTPEPIIQGQRAIYQGVTIAEANTEAILLTYETDCKAAIAYHFNFIYQQKIDEAKMNLVLQEEELRLRVLELETNRDSEIKDAFQKIEAKTKLLRDANAENIALTKKLIESVYGYFSTTPIQVDNIPAIIEQLEEARKSHGQSQN